MNTAFQLFQVQQIDSDIDRAAQRIIEIDALIQNNKSISAAEKVLENNQQVFIKKN